MLNELFSQLMGSGTLSQISGALGTDEGTTQSAMQTALPVLVGAAARQASTPEGAGTLMGILDSNQDGNVLDDLAGYLGQPQTASVVGNPILDLLFGGQRSHVEAGLSNSTGLNTGQIGSLLLMLAPIVMGFLGKMKQEQGLDFSGLAGLLGQQTQQMEQGGMPIMGVLSGLIDQNKDGNPVDDLARMAGSFFGNRR